MFGTYITATASVRSAVEDKIDEIFISAWRGTLKQPLQCLTKIMTDVQTQGIRKTLENLNMDSAALIESCAQGSFLVTGLSDGAKANEKDTLLTATEYLKFQLDAFKEYEKSCKSEKDVSLAGKTMRGLFDTYKLVLCRGDQTENLALNVTGTFKELNIEQPGSVSVWVENSVNQIMNHESISNPWFIDSVALARNQDPLIQNSEIFAWHKTTDTTLTNYESWIRIIIIIYNYKLINN